MDSAAHKAESIRAALRCGRVGCPCGRPGGNAHCPRHDDRHPSLSVDVRGDKVLLHCHSACSQAAVISALRERGLCREREGGEGGRISPERTRTLKSAAAGETRGPGLRLKVYAAAKRLPIEFLRNVGLSDIPNYAGAPAVRIPYRFPDGSEAAVRFRVALDGDRFRWRRGSKPLPYGLDGLDLAREQGRVVLVEGESDAHTLWHYGVPALGLPGASTWRDEWAEHLDGVWAIYVVVEPDDGGAALLDRLAHSSLRDRLQVVHLPDGVKDCSALHLDDHARFEGRLKDALEAAEPWADLANAAASVEAAEALSASGGLLDAGDLWERIRDTIHDRGYVGDAAGPLLAYLGMSSRLLPRPVNLVAVAPSAAGKNHAIDAAAELMPGEAVYRFSAGSALALVYSDEDFGHRVVIAAEVDSLPDDGPAGSAIRALAEDNELRYDVVERDPKSGEHRTRRIVRRGPTSLVTTSTRSLAPQLGTRILEFGIADTEAQTREVLRQHARIAAGTVAAAPDVEPFVAAQRWLGLAGEHRIVVPFAEKLVEQLDARQVRTRRDARQLLALIASSALLHQRQRARDPEGRVVATIDDYGIVYGIVARLFEAIASEGLTPAIRETVEAVPEGAEISSADLAARVGIARGTLSWRLRRALAGGWIVNREQRRGRPHRLARGAPLPDERSALPDPERLREVFEGSSPVRVGVHPPSPVAVDSGARGTAERRGFAI